MKSHRPWGKNPQLVLLGRGRVGTGVAALRLEGSNTLWNHPNYWCLRWCFLKIGTAELNQLHDWAVGTHSRSFKSP